MKGKAAAVFAMLGLLAAAGAMAVAPVLQGGLIVLQPQNQPIAPPFDVPNEAICCTSPMAPACTAN
jgi:hypothetical protein